MWRRALAMHWMPYPDEKNAQSLRMSHPQRMQRNPDGVQQQLPQRLERAHTYRAGQSTFNVRNDNPTNSHNKSNQSVRTIRTWARWRTFLINSLMPSTRWWQKFRKWSSQLKQTELFPPEPTNGLANGISVFESFIIFFFLVKNNGCRWSVEILESETK